VSVFLNVKKLDVFLLFLLFYFVITVLINLKILFFTRTFLTGKAAYFIVYYTDSERAGDGDPEESCGSGQAQAGLGPGAHQRRDCAAHQGHAAQHAVSVEFERSQHH
jgi:hypothetical protein